jgi:hypothetical protein
MDEMTFDEATKHMVEKGNLTEPNARAEVGRYCSWPTQASSYLTGMLEIMEIRTRWLARTRRVGPARTARVPRRDHRARGCFRRRWRKRRLGMNEQS